MSLMIGVFFFFKQKTAYEMRISDWSSDVCSSDLIAIGGQQIADPVALEDAAEIPAMAVIVGELGVLVAVVDVIDVAQKFDVGPKPARSRALGIAFEHLMHLEVGRAAWWERVFQSVEHSLVAVTLIKHDLIDAIS